MGVTAGVIGAVAAVGGTAATIENSAQQRRLAGQALDRQNYDKAQADKAAAAEKERLQNASATAALSDTTRQQRAATGAGDNKNGTLLTGYSGSQIGQSPTGGKTLLGG